MLALFTISYLVCCGDKDLLKASHEKSKFDPNQLPYSNRSQEEALIGNEKENKEQDDIEASMIEAENKKLMREIESLADKHHRELTPQTRRHRSRLATTQASSSRHGNETDDDDVTVIESPDFYQNRTKSGLNSQSDFVRLPIDSDERALSIERVTIA